MIRDRPRYCGILWDTAGYCGILRNRGGMRGVGLVSGSAVGDLVAVPAHTPAPRSARMPSSTPENVVDLRSDTVTRPSPGMRRAIAEAEVGDAALGDDPTVNELERSAGL